MERRKFGDTGLEVSAVALGCWIFGVDWWGHYTQEDCNRLCSFWMDQGVSFFDNGDAYGNGRAEILFGNWMKEANIHRSKAGIGSKSGYTFSRDPGIPVPHSERQRGIARCPFPH